MKNQNQLDKAVVSPAFAGGSSRLLQNKQSFRPGQKYKSFNFDISAHSQITV